MQRVSRNFQRRNDGNLGFIEFESEIVFFKDLIFGPSPRPIEFRDQKSLLRGRIVRLNTELIDAILVTIEREHSSVATITGGLNRIEYAIGSQLGIGRRLGHTALWPCASGSRFKENAFMLTWVRTTVNVNRRP